MSLHDPTRTSLCPVERTQHCIFVEYRDLWVEADVSENSGDQAAIGVPKAGRARNVRKCHSGHRRCCTHSRRACQSGPEPTKGGKADWVGLGIAAVGLVTAVIGLFKG